MPSATPEQEQAAKDKLDEFSKALDKIKEKVDQLPDSAKDNQVSQVLLASVVEKAAMVNRFKTMIGLIDITEDDLNSFRERMNANLKLLREIFGVAADFLREIVKLVADLVKEIVGLIKSLIDLIVDIFKSIASIFEGSKGEASVEQSGDKVSMSGTTTTKVTLAAGLAEVTGLPVELGSYRGAWKASLLRAAETERTAIYVFQDYGSAPQDVDLGRGAALGLHQRLDPRGYSFLEIDKQSGEITGELYTLFHSRSFREEDGPIRISAEVTGRQRADGKYDFAIESSDVLSWRRIQDLLAPSTDGGDVVDVVGRLRIPGNARVRIGARELRVPAAGISVASAARELAGGSSAREIRELLASNPLRIDAAHLLGARSVAASSAVALGRPQSTSVAGVDGALADAMRALIGAGLGGGAASAATPVDEAASIVLMPAERDQPSLASPPAVAPADGLIDVD